MLSTKAAPARAFREFRALLSSLSCVLPSVLTTLNGFSILFVSHQRSKQPFQSALRAHPVLAAILPEPRIDKQCDRSLGSRGNMAPTGAPESLSVGDKINVVGVAITFVAAVLSVALSYVTFRAHVRVHQRRGSFICSCFSCDR